MYKLLTPQGKEEVLSEYKARRTSVLLSLVVTLILVFIIAILPSFIYARLALDSAKLSLESSKGLYDEGKQEKLEEWIQDFNAKLTSVTPSAIEVEPRNFFIKALESRPSGVKVTALSWQEVSDNPSVRVGGIAKDRQTLIVYQNNLRTSLNWKEVSLPVDVLVNETDVKFEFSLIPKEQ